MRGAPALLVAALVAFLALAAWAFAWLAPQARAGSYEVVACGGAAGGAQNAFAAAADPQMAAYSICPNTPSNPATGIVTRASATTGPGSVPYFAGAYQIFEAPPGATLMSVSFDLAAIRLANHWTTGILAYDGDFNVGEGPYGCYAWGPGCAIGLPSFFGPVTVGLGGHSKFRFESRCVNFGRCDISASGYTPGMRALFSAANVRVRLQDFSTPVIQPNGGALWGGGWHRGREEAWQGLTDNVGIATLRLIVDGVMEEAQDYRGPEWPPWVRCDFTMRRPCHDIQGGVTLDTASLSDGRHSIRVEAVDAAGNFAALDHAIDVDNSAPARVNAGIEGGEGWRRSNDFTLRWAPSGEQASPIASAYYRLCTTDPAPRCSTASRSARGTDKLTEIAVPANGEYTLRVWLEDEAGNSSESAASDPVRLRLDSSPPELAAFELLDEQDPRRLDVLVSDSTSGVADGTIEMRRSGWRQWHPLRSSLSSGRLSAQIDDLDLPDGVYELRARVSDRAGNERVSDRREDGSKMELTLPLRSASRIVLSARSKRVVRGRLETTDGKRLAGSPIAIFEQPRTGKTFRPAGTLRSNARGGFRYPLTRGPSRTIQFRYGGTTRIKPATRALKLRVPARTTIATGRTFLRNGESVRFSGRLLGRPAPDGGKLIDLQAYYRGKWRTFATPRTDAAGRWRFRYRFEATRGLVRYRFRARIRREAAYPYELGYSRVVAVTVRGR